MVYPRKLLVGHQGIGSFWDDLTNVGEVLTDVAIDKASTALDRELLELKATLATTATLSLISASCGVWLLFKSLQQ
jgi:hypothetical protein